jgi:hypothetical protein
LQPEDSFLLTWLYPTLAGSFTHNILLRWLRADGEIITTLIPVPSTIAVSSFSFTMGEGFLLSATLSGLGQPPLEPGTIFYTFNVIRNVPNTLMVMWQLISDYLTAAHFPTWPYGRMMFPTEGPGRLRSIVGGTPGAGGEISESVPAFTRWSLLSFRASIATSAVVASRKTSFVIDDGVNVLFQSDSNLVVTASNNGQATLCNTGFVNAIITNAACIAPCPLIFLNAGYRIRTLTSGIDVGDQYASPKYLVQEWMSR